ncbi:hypothetical protein FACS1894102_0360 [Spirochaetia bacterium]|nr:hypothetical protein FACS1894102_0360 [Spirochaetia bacterium]
MKKLFAVMAFMLMVSGFVIAQNQSKVDTSKAEDFQRQIENDIKEFNETFKSLTGANNQRSLDRILANLQNKYTNINGSLKKELDRVQSLAGERDITGGDLTMYVKYYEQVLEMKRDIDRVVSNFRGPLAATK